MKLKISQIIPSFIITILVLIVLEILITTLLPILGIEHYRLPFNILIILFLAFKLETPFIACLILVVQLFYSIFSVEGWAYGTFAGIIVCIIISYLRDMLHFDSKLFTVFVTQIFQVVWFIIVSFLIYLRLGTTEYILLKLARFLPESIVISLIAPFFFMLLDQIWRVREGGVLGEND